MSDAGIIHTILECKRCNVEDEYYIAPENWPTDIECSGCERNGPFAVAGDGVIEFTDVKARDIRFDGLEQIQYRPAEPEEYDPPKGHKQVGGLEFMQEQAPPSTVPDDATLIQAMDSDRLDEQEAKRAWDDVRELFNKSENGSTTRAYTKAAKILSDVESFVAVRDSGELWYYRDDLGYYVRKGETFPQGHSPSGSTTQPQSSSINCPLAARSSCRIV